METPKASTFVISGLLKVLIVVASMCATFAFAQIAWGSSTWNFQKDLGNRVSFVDSTNYRGMKAYVWTSFNTSNLINGEISPIDCILTDVTAVVSAVQSGSSWFSNEDVTIKLYQSGTQTTIGTLKLDGSATIFSFTPDIVITKGQYVLYELYGPVWATNGSIALGISGQCVAEEEGGGTVVNLDTSGIEERLIPIGFSIMLGLFLYSAYFAHHLLRRNE